MSAGSCPRCGAASVELVDGKFTCSSCGWSMPAPWDARSWHTARRSYLWGLSVIRRDQAKAPKARQATYEPALMAYRHTLALLRMQRSRLTFQR